MRERLQAGYVYEAGGRWYVRYWRTEMKDSKPQRVQVSEFLCDKDKVYYSTDCRALRLKRDEFMLRVNQKRVTSDTTVTDFWSSTYLPFAEKTVRQSALGPYKQIWNRHLKDHFGNVALRDYKTSDMYRHLLAKLHSEKLGRRTINHIRTVASAVFQHATNIGACDMNPIRGMKLSKLPEPAETQHYTLDEAEHIINALVDRTDAQLLFALTFYMALRPSAAVALLWSDIDAETLNVRRSCVRGVLGPC